MKGWIAVGVVGLIVVVGAGVVIAEGGSSNQGSDGPHVVAVSGTASVSTAPNEAIVTLAVKTQTPSSSTTQSENAAKTKAVLSALSSLGVAKSDVKTTNFSFNPQTQNRGTKHQRTVYVEQNQLTVTIHNLQNVGAIVDAALKAGATTVGDIQFTLSSQTNFRQQALTAAVKTAQQKAQVMAQAAGASLGPVVSIREQGSSYPRPVFAAAGGLAAIPSPAPTTPVVPPSNIQTRVTVNVVWSLDG